MTSRRKRTSERPPSSTSVGRMTILLEQIQEQNRATIEAVHSQGTSLRREMREIERNLTLRIEALELAVRKNSEDIQQMKKQLAELTDVVRGKADAAELKALEVRVARLEERVGLRGGTS